MSRENKVNPGMYTQRGRLTPDDTARELKKQRDLVALGSQARRAKEPEPHQNAPHRVTKKDKRDKEEEREDSVEE